MFEFGPRDVLRILDVTDELGIHREGVTIPLQNEGLRRDFHAALSIILFNKVKTIEVSCSNLHELWALLRRRSPEQLWLN